MALLFDGNDSEGRFGKIEQRVLKEHAAVLDIGALICDIGTHSTRKGVISKGRTDHYVPEDDLESVVSWRSDAADTPVSASTGT